MYPQAHKSLFFLLFLAGVTLGCRSFPASPKPDASLLKTDGDSANEDCNTYAPLAKFHLLPLFPNNEPYVTRKNNELSHKHKEIYAIDLATKSPVNAPIRATHAGTVRRLKSDGIDFSPITETPNPDKCPKLSGKQFPEVVSYLHALYPLYPAPSSPAPTETEMKNFQVYLDCFRFVINSASYMVIHWQAQENEPEVIENLESLYMHFASIEENIVVGATVSTGQILGTIGATGNAGGPHLHYQVQNYSGPGSSYYQQSLCLGENETSFAQAELEISPP